MRDAFLAQSFDFRFKAGGGCGLLNLGPGLAPRFRSRFLASRRSGSLARSGPRFTACLSTSLSAILTYRFLRLLRSGVLTSFGTGNLPSCRTRRLPSPGSRFLTSFSPGCKTGSRSMVRSVTIIVRRPQFD